MKLYLARHGTANPATVDPEKGLSEKGKQDVGHVLQLLKDAGVSVDEIFHSGKARAQQTADIFAPLSATPPQPKNGLSPNDDVEPIAGELEHQQNDLMLVGHLPFMNRLASTLLAGNAEADLTEFQAGSVLMLVREDDRWHIQWMVGPEL